VTVLHSGIALVAGAVTAVIGSSPGLELSEVAAGSVTALAGLAAATAAVRLIRLHRVPLPPQRGAPATLPPPGSAAREPMVRLADAHAALTDLLGVLARSRHGVVMVAAETLESTRAAFAEATTELRGTADAIRALERAASGGPELLDAVTALRAQLDEGVDEACGLVSAAGAVVAAAGTDHRPAALAEATDRLTGLAEGLRELPRRAT
jgi:hypothetical protein